MTYRARHHARGLTRANRPRGISRASLGSEFFDVMNYRYSPYGIPDWARQCFKFGWMTLDQAVEAGRKEKTPNPILDGGAWWPKFSGKERTA